MAGHPSSTYAVLIIGTLVLVLGAVIIGVVERNDRAWAVTCVVGTVVALLAWLLLFRLLFGVGA